MQLVGTLKAQATGSAVKTGGYEMTASGRVLLVALLCVIGMAGYLYTDSHGVRRSSAEGPTSQKEPARAPQPIVSPEKQEAAGPVVHAEAKESTREGQREATSTVMLAALRATAEAQNVRLAEAERTLADLETLLASKATTPKGKEEISVSTQAARKTVATAKAAKVDVSALPVDFMTVEKSGISVFDKESVVIAGARHAVGSRLPSGELLVAVDPQSRTVVTDKRIVNVPN
ncbi:hypothetical protein Tamer19_42540 [Cupriavidus sp. TA19]|uniref:hypothetical protein n=1 Tax=unclassified Cupriavidus TaxID=2640874 RepID=UPI000E2F1DF1|nr:MULTISPECIES: hypothetical protein [unclassified Cupriavidus]BDB30484.1 hypothetical protein CTP10_R79010 [Cupriavidus sp. P-10]GLC94846.1 hypothetical protein Tamer19_42540 [Cupriavidus sp. TA19]